MPMTSGWTTSPGVGMPIGRAWIAVDRLAAFAAQDDALDLGFVRAFRKCSHECAKRSVRGWRSRPAGRVRP